MNQDQVRGWWSRFRGRTKIAVGDLTDDESLRAEGSLDALAGRIQQKFGDAREVLRRGFRRRYWD